MTATVDAPNPVIDDLGPASGPSARTAAHSPGGMPTKGRTARWLRGRPDDPAWARPALIALLAGTAILYLWGLGASGWANSFYSAAVQAGSHSWKAFFFGSSDAANFITVDKIPGSLWIMDLSARIFGVNAWSILVPQALEGVAAVGVLYATVKRWFGPAAGLLAGAVLALTPIATLMFRFNNPDALLMLLLTAGAYFLTRALEDTRTRWVVLAFAMVGFGFLAKMLQAFLVVPAFGLVYLLAAPTNLRRRIGQLALGAAAMIAAGGWWVAIVEAIPASARPYIGGSQNNSILNLLFGYNGFGRLSGNETGSVGGGGAAAGANTSMWGPTGWSRLFNREFGGQASWLLPTALVLLVGAIALRGLRDRNDRTRAALLLWGGWLLVTAAVFSFGKGIIHPYYTVALAPAIGAVVGIGAVSAWQRRSEPAARLVLSAALAATVAWAAVLFHRSPSWYPWMSPVVLVVGLIVALALLITPRLRGGLAAVVAGAAIVAALAGPAAASVTTAATTHGGSIPSAGPTVVGGNGFGGGPGGGPGGGRGFGGFGGARPTGMPTGALPTGALPTGALPNGATGAGGFPPSFGGAGRAAGNAGGIGGLLNGSTPSAAAVKALDANHSHYTWVAAAIGSNEAAGYQLSSGHPVMAIGGFNGSDPTPTLAQFEKLVHEGKIHYFIASGMGGGAGQGQASSTSQAIESWVTSTFHSTTVGGVTLYDLTSTTGS